MKFHEDRGTILRITFDIVYPNGQMKTVSMSMADYDEWKNAGLIALNEEAVKKFIKPALDNCEGEIKGDEAISLYDTVEEDTDMKPAILILHNDGKVTPKCGAHHSSGHMERKNPVNRFM